MLYEADWPKCFVVAAGLSLIYNLEKTSTALAISSSHAVAAIAEVHHHHDGRYSKVRRRDGVNTSIDIRESWGSTT